MGTRHNKIGQLAVPHVSRHGTPLANPSPPLFCRGSFYHTRIIRPTDLGTPVDDATPAPVVKGETELPPLFGRRTMIP